MRDSGADDFDFATSHGGHDGLGFNSADLPPELGELVRGAVHDLMGGEMPADDSHESHPSPWIGEAATELRALMADDRRPV